MINKIKYTLVICLAVCLGIFTSCSDDNQELTEVLGENQGQVIFSFSRINTFHVDDLLDIKTIKVTLRKGGNDIVLPSCEMFGTKDSVATKPVAVEAGSYAVYKYIVFDAKGDMLYEAYPEEEEYFEVVQGETFQFFFPVKIRVDISSSLLKNKLLGICHEIWGNDTIKWPKTWREYNNEPRTWENLYWELDGYNNAAYISGIRFDETFSGMKTLPRALTGMVYMTNIDVINLPEFTDLGDHIGDLNIQSLYLENTGVTSFPKQMSEMGYLYSLTVIDCAITEIPEELAEISTFNALHFDGTEVSEIPYELIEKFSKLKMFDIKNSKITSIPDNFFVSLSTISSFNFSGNKGLSSLPSAINPVQSNLRGLNISGCSFTSVPELVKKAKVRTLIMDDNQLTSFSQEDLTSEIEVLHINGNSITEFPALKSEVLTDLRLSNNPISVLPDLSGYPELVSFHMGGTGINEIPDNYFINNPKLAWLHLNDNAALVSVSANAGFPVVKFTQEINGVVVEREAPKFLKEINVNNCPALKWEIPSVWLAPEINGPNTGIILSKDGSAGVTIK